MPASYLGGYADLTATGRYAFPIGSGDNVGQLAVGTYATTTWTTTATVQVNPFTEGQDPDGLGWQNIQVIRQDTGASEDTPTLTANTARAWVFNVAGMAQAALNVTAITGDIPTSLSSYFTPRGLGVVNTNSVSPSISGTLTITSTSASALTVGPNGATNPVLKINANTSSAATGVSVTGAAAAGGVAVAAISSGTDEALTINAKGAGIVEIGGVSTGQIFLGRGGLKAPIVSNTLTALGTTQSSTPTAAQIIGGTLTQTGSTGAGAVTLPTGTAISAAFGRTVVAGDSFECWFMNVGGSQTLTITGATGTTVTGTAAVASGTPCLMKWIATSATAWNIYCLANA